MFDRQSLLAFLQPEGDVYDGQLVRTMLMFKLVFVTQGSEFTDIAIEDSLIDFGISTPFEWDDFDAVYEAENDEMARSNMTWNKYVREIANHLSIPKARHKEFRDTIQANLENRFSEAIRLLSNNPAIDENDTL